MKVYLENILKDSGDMKQKDKDAIRKRFPKLVAFILLLRSAKSLKEIREYKLPILIDKTLEYGFSGSHFWVHADGKRIILAHE